MTIDVPDVRQAAQIVPVRRNDRETWEDKCLGSPPLGGSRRGQANHSGVCGVAVRPIAMPPGWEALYLRGADDCGMR